MQYGYIIKVTDSAGKVLSPARITFLAANKSPLMYGGKEIFVELYSGTNNISSEESTLLLKVSSPGYADKIITALPGLTAVQLTTTQAASVQAGSKWVLVLIVVAVIIYLLVKYNGK